MKNKGSRSAWSKILWLFPITAVIATFPFSSTVNSKQIQPTDGYKNVKQEGGKSKTRIVKVKSTTRYKIGQDKEIKAVFEGLKPEALELGLNDAVLFGRPTTKEASGGKIRVKIDWHTISAQGSKTASVSGKLQPALQSQFLVVKNDKNVEPGTIIPAKGDFGALTETFLALQDKIKKNQSIEIASAESDDDSSSRDRDLSSSSSDSDFSSGTNSNEISEADTASGTDNYDSNLITTTWEDCYPRVSELEEKLYLQHQEIQTNSDGTINSTGECADTGQTITASRVWGETDAGCPNIYDFDAGLAYFQYIAVAQYNEQEIVVRDCYNDQSQYASIQATSVNCGWRHDFDLGFSVQQEELYYMMGSSPSYITACQDQTTSYTHYETSMTCDPAIDAVNNLYFPASRIAFTLNDGTVDYATECRVLDGVGYAISEQFCNPKYEHDYLGGTSYYLTKDVYTDGDGVQQPLTECLRSGTTSFPHLTDTDACPIDNDNVNLQTTFYGTLYIDTPDDGILELEACHQIGVPLAYVRVDDYAETEFTSSATWTVPPGVNEAFVTLVGAGEAGEAGGNGGAARAIAGSTTTYGGAGGNGGRGGAAGQVKDNVRVPVAGQTSISITIGTASGADSSFGSLLTASGGTGYDTIGGPGGNPVCVDGGGTTCTNENGANGFTGSTNGYGGNGGTGGVGGTYIDTVNGTCFNGGGSGGGSGGQGGFGTTLLTQTATAGTTGTGNIYFTPGNPGQPGTRSYGYGAGGPGGGGGAGAPGTLTIAPTSSPGSGGPGGKNAPGYAKIGFTAISYIRGDGTIYYIP